MKRPRTAFRRLTMPILRKHTRLTHLLLAAAAATALLQPASASDRYPTATTYVNQYGQVVVAGATTRPQPIARQAPMLIAMPAPVRVLQPVRTAPLITAPARPSVAQPLVRIAAPASTPLRGTINSDPADWPSGRTCCRPGQPYFDEQPG
jgi:hypothetical protein